MCDATHCIKNKQVSSKPTQTFWGGEKETQEEAEEGIMQPGQ
jgi:hypothetical protein